jgi:hypothetical protein
MKKALEIVYKLVYSSFCYTNKLFTVFWLYVRQQCNANSSTNTCIEYEIMISGEKLGINVRDKFNVIHIPCHRLTTQCLIQHIAKSVINNYLSLMSLLHVSTSARSSSGR